MARITVYGIIRAYTVKISIPEPAMLLFSPIVWIVEYLGLQGIQVLFWTKSVQNKTTLIYNLVANESTYLACITET